MPVVASYHIIVTNRPMKEMPDHSIIFEEEIISNRSPRARLDVYWIGNEPALSFFELVSRTGDVYWTSPAWHYTQESSERLIENSVLYGTTFQFSGDAMQEIVDNKCSLRIIRNDLSPTSLIPIIGINYDE